MTAHASWTTSGPPHPATRTLSGCRLRTLAIPGLGPVLEVVLSGRQDPDFWQSVRDVLREEIPGRSPRFLVFDLRGLDCIVGSALLGGLVAGALEMKRLGRLGGARIVATGEIATRLTRTLSLCKLEPVLGAVHGDMASALYDAPARGDACGPPRPSRHARASSSG